MRKFLACSIVDCLEGRRPRRPWSARPLTLQLLVLALFTSMAFAEEGFHTNTFAAWDGNPLIPGSTWKVHDNNRPQPLRIVPGSYVEQGVQAAPADAEILFDGTSLDGFWKNEWFLKDGYVVAGKGSLGSRKAYGDCQLHIEWRTPNPLVLNKYVSNHGNSGIYFMNRYELQIHDSYSIKMYADGTAGAIYGQTPPLVNVSRKPGEWQTFDVYFKAPVFEGEKLVSPARMTVLHNGVFVQVDTELTGQTEHNKLKSYEPHKPREPFFIQGTKNPVAFRNIWIRDLEE